jgi:hypothetical protein
LALRARDVTIPCVFHNSCAEDETTAKMILLDQLAKREPIDVVLTDLVMQSEQRGMTLLQEARALDPFMDWSGGWGMAR